MKRFLRSQHKLPVIVTVFFFLAFIVPGGEVNETISTVLGVVGLLFAIIVGFFINDLWSRYQTIRGSVATEVSGLQTHFLFVKVYSHMVKDSKWIEEQRSLIASYVRKYFEVEWDSYGETDTYFNAIIESLKNVPEAKTNNETETYTNMLPVLNEVSTARAKLAMYGKDTLSRLEWAVVYFLGGILLFSILRINTGEPTSIFLVGTLASAIAILISILHDLNSMSYGEEMVSFEPYETIFDVLEVPRFYRKQDIESGRVSLPEGDDSDYQLVE